jgi:hypothetical protein
VRAPRADRALALIAALFTLIGIVLRFWPRRELWLDEALSANIASLPLGEIPAALKHDGHPPLYYFLLHLWMTIGSSDWWLRAFSGIVSLLGLPLIYLAGRRLGARRASDGLGARRTGAIAIALWAVLPFAVRYGAETRMYALISVLVLVGYLLVDSLVGEPREHDLGPPPTRAATAGLVIVTAALLYTHYWALWLGAATAIVVAAVGWRSVDPDRRRGAWKALGAMAAGVVLFVPWIPTMVYQSAHTGTPWGEVFRPATILVVTITDFVGGGFGEMQIMSYALVVAITVAAFGILRARSGQQVVELTAVPRARIGAELSVLLLTMGIGWVTSVVAASTFVSRYAAVVAPLFVLCSAAGLAMVRTRRATAIVTALSCAALVVGSVAEIVSDRTQTGVVADVIATEVAAEAEQSDAVVITCPDQLGPATLRALENRGVDATVLPFPGGDPRFVDWVDYGDRNSAADPVAFVDALRSELDDSTTVYAVINTEYLTFEGKCDGLLNALGADGAQMENLVVADAQNFFEGMSLWVARPSS